MNNARGSEMKIVNEVRNIGITNQSYDGLKFNQPVTLYVSYDVDDSYSPMPYLTILDSKEEFLKKIEFEDCIEELSLIHTGDIAIDARLCASDGIYTAYSQALEELFAPYSKLEFLAKSDEDDESTPDTVEIVLTVEVPGRKKFVTLANLNLSEINDLMEKA